MELNLRNKNALVCGSSQGIGRSIAKELASNGATVTLFARNKDKLQQVQSELSREFNQNHQVLLADFSDYKQVKATVQNHISDGYSYQILVNNTGGPAPGPAHLARPEEYLSGFEQHLIINQILMQALLKGMKDSQYGRIINIISTSVKQPLEGLGVSNTIRGAVANWSKTLAHELGPFGITVNNILPGATNTNRLKAILENKSKKFNKSLDEITHQEQSKIPMKRFGEPEELAAVVAFISSSNAAYINGVNIPVDGGRTSCL